MAEISENDLKALVAASVAVGALSALGALLKAAVEQQQKQQGNN